jgi:hypothetical protein
MELVGSPIVTMVLNIVAAFLISKGILDIRYRETFIQLANNAIAGIVTVSVALYSIFKMVDLQKHKITATTQADQQNFSQPISQTVPSGQTGLPASPLKV